MKKTLTFTLVFLTMIMTYSQDFIEKIIDNSFNDTLHAVSIDLDGDGDKDIVGTAYTADEVAWYENDGMQNYTKHSIDTTINGAIYVTAYDADADGDIDLVVNAYDGNAIYSFRNDGSQNFTKYLVDGSANGSNYNTIGDFDGNTIIDLVSANSGDNDLALYSLAIGPGGPFIAKTIIDGSFMGANTVEATDIDNDGDLDLLATAYNGDEIAWYENDGSANFIKHSIDTSAIGALTAYPVDFDSDGDIDFIASISGRLLPVGGDEVAWYENDGSQNFTKHIVDASSDYASFGQAADFDNDGDLDIVASATNSNEMRWYESDGGSPPTFITHTILGGSIGDSYSIDIDDMDGDGWVDIVSASPGNDSIRIFDNIIGSTVIPDAIFENYLETHDASGGVVTLGDPTSMGNGIAGDHKVFTARINTVVSLNVSNLGIVDLTGIEGFTDLQKLYCQFNDLSSIDVSKNLNLKTLYCYDNLLTDLNVSNNILLNRLFCYNNQLTNINVSTNTALKLFYCYNNLLSSIDLSSLTNMTILRGYKNNLTSLDVSANIALVELSVYSNTLTSLDVSNNPALITLYCFKNSITNLDITTNNKLKILHCQDNVLADLNTTNVTSLKILRCFKNSLTSLDLSTNTALIELKVADNPFLNTLSVKNGNNINVTLIDFQNNPELYCIEVDDPVYSDANWTLKDVQHYFTLECKTIWTGSPAAWTNGIPVDGTKDVGVESPYDTSIEGNIFGKSLITTSPDGDILITDGNYVNIIGNVENNSSITVEQGGSFVQKDDLATVTGIGSFNVLVAINPIPLNTTNPSHSARYTYFSSPTQSETLNVFSSWAEMSDIYSFNEMINDWQSETVGTIMDKGIGYIARTKNSATYPVDGTTAATGLTTFTGAFNNGVSVHNLVYNIDGTDDDSILVGNPYPSAISTAKIFTDNSSVTALHFWRHAQGADASGNFNESYAVKTATGSTFGAPSTISTGQGFFAEASATGTLTFKNDLREIGNNDTFLRPVNNLDKAWFNITTSSGVEAQVQVGFISTCTDDFDNQHDAHNISSGSYLELYTNGVGVNAQDLVIQARAPLANNDAIIPLGFKMNNAAITDLTISLDHFENLIGYEILLKDLDLNIIHNIKQSDYHFTINQTGDFGSRFEILFNRSTLSIDKIILSNEDIILSNLNANSLNVKTINGGVISSFKVYDILGKLVLNTNPNSNNFDINNDIDHGTILFVKATLTNGQIISKKFIKL